MPVKELTINALLPSELATVTKEVAASLDKAPVEAVLLHDVTNDMNKSVADIEERTGEKEDTTITETLGVLDTDRDLDYNDFTDCVKGARHHIEPDIAEAGVLVYDVIKRHGPRIDKEAYAVESHKLNALILDLKEPNAQKAIETLRLTRAYEKMVADQQKFELAHKARAEFHAAHSFAQMKEFVAPLRENLKEGLNILNSYEKRNPEAYSAIVETVNELITEYMAKVHNRRTRRKNGIEAGTVSPEPVAMK